MKITQKIKKLFNNTDYWVEEIIQTIIRNDNQFVPELDIQLGMPEQKLYSQILDLVLREDNKFECFNNHNYSPEKIVTCTYWPENREVREIYRFVIRDKILDGIFIEIGVSGNFEKIYKGIVTKLKSDFTTNIIQYKDPFKFKKDKDIFHMFAWSNKKLHMFLRVLWAHPLRYDRNEIIKKYIFIDQKNKLSLVYQPWKIEDYIEGMFIKEGDSILPTIGVLFALNKENRNALKNYLIYSMQRFPKSKT